MPDVQHAQTTTVHRVAYVGSSDPGTVGAYVGWIDTTTGPPYILKVRNAANTGWDTVGQTAGLTQGTYAAARPSTPHTGDVYEPTDANVWEEYNGSTWDGYWPRMKLVKPVDSTATWVNQSVATSTQQGPQVWIATAAGSAGTQGGSARVWANPAATWTAILGFLPSLGLGGGATQNCGILLKQNAASPSGTVNHHWTYGLWNDNVFRMSQWTNDTTFSNHTVSITPAFKLYGPLCWLRVVNDGTNLLFYVSTDRNNWSEMYRVTNITWATIDRIGYYVSTNAITPSAAGGQTGMTVLSWELNSGVTS